MRSADCNAGLASSLVIDPECLLAWLERKVPGVQPPTA
jgi:hypothetical protein